MNKTNLLSIALLSTLSLGALSLGAHSAELANSDAQSAKLPFGTTVNHMYDLGSKSKVNRASSKLTRDFGELCISTNTAELPVGAYTNWWMVFNNPEFCENPRGFGGSKCGGPDVANPDVDATVMWSAAGIVNADTKGHFSSCLAEGELSHYVLMGTGSGLTDSQKAEIQLVVRYHGPVDAMDATLLGEQLTSFSGGCANEAEGIEGHECNNLQVTIHSPAASKNR
ncbi:MAG: hypothetical protein ACI9FJ_001952 [Alteromonadaceae bacterium]|jgi:hypothetical protein